MTLHGRLVVLRPVTEADYPLLQAWQNDHDVARWMDYRTPFSLRDVAADQERAMAEGVPFVIEAGGRPIGKCGLNQFREATVPECALYIYIGDVASWGRGLGVDACTTLVTYAFDQRGRERVELTMLATNERARRTYERCGFVLAPTRTGRSYRAGEWRETVVMVCTKETFAAARRTGPTTTLS